MFKDIGTKIKTIAKITFVAEVIGGVILAFNIWSSGMGSHGDQGVWTFFSGLICLVAAFGASWVGASFLYGFGELIDSVQNCDYHLSRLSEKRSNSVDERSNDVWFCECGTKNPARSSYCETCGKKKR